VGRDNQHLCGEAVAAADKTRAPASSRGSSRLGALDQARLAASLGVDHSRLFAALEDEVRRQLIYLSEKPLEL
jgi:hypothetical protein